MKISLVLFTAVNHVVTCMALGYLHATKVKMNHEDMIFGHAGVIVLVIHSLW